MEHLATVKIGTPGYPARLASSNLIEPPAMLWAYGPIDIIAEPTIGLFCSSQCSGSIILKTFDVITKMRDEGQIIIGGFHSVMEWECLGVLLRGRQPVVWVPARSIAGMRLKPGLQPAFEEGRLLILSPFTPAQNRITKALAQQRNRFVGTLADRIFVPHAAPGSRTLAHCSELSAMGKKIATIDDPLNAALLSLAGVERLA